MKTKNLSAFGPLIVIIAAILWGSVGIFTKYLYSEGFTAHQVSLLRCFFATIIIVPYMIIRHKNQIKLRSWKDLLFFFISGSVGMALCYTTYFLTIEASTLSIAAVMLYSAPIMVTILAAVLFKEKITLMKMISIILAFTGCIVMSGILGGASISLSIKGIAVGFLSGLGYALYNIGSRYALAHYSTYAVTTYTFIFAFAGMLFVTPVGNTITLLTSNPENLIVAFALGVIPTLIPYTLYVLALNYVEVSKASVLAIIEPVAATFIGLIAYNEKLTPNVIIAIIIIFLSVIVSNIKTGRKSTFEKAEIEIESDTDSTWIAEHSISEKFSERIEKQEELEEAFIKNNILE